MRDILLIQDELDIALSESTDGNITIHLSLDKYYNMFGGIYSFLKEEINIICAKHNVSLFHANNLFEQIYNLKDKSYLAVIGKMKANKENVKTEDVKDYILDYVNKEYYKPFIKIQFRKD